MTFSVQVINNEKRPQSGCCVEVYLPESFPLLPDDAKITEYTDEDGRTRFEPQITANQSLRFSTDFLPPTGQ